MNPTIKRYGLIYAAVNSGIVLLMFGLGLDTNDSAQKATGLAATAASIIITYFLIRDFRDKENNGFLTVGQGLGAGFKMSALAGAIIAVFNWIYYKIINPGFLNYARLKQEEELAESGLSDAQIEQSMAMAEKFTGPGVYALMSFFGAILIVFVFSLIISAFLKKENPDEIS
jgi:hypothetical protein